MDNTCPGCLDCGEDCDAWAGVHLWVEYHKYPDGTGNYDQCDFCGKRIEYTNEI